MINIEQHVIDKMIADAKKSYPIEACGYLAGNDNTISQIYEMRNIDNSEEHFSFDPSEQFAVVRKVRENGTSIIANYHSHPKTPARPSEEDIRIAYDPEIIYIIVSLAEDTPQIKAFRIKKPLVQEVEIKVK